MQNEAANINRWLLCGLAAWWVLLLPAHAERLPVKLYTSADGLGSTFVDYIMRDSRGFIWLCTRDGLSRFDGAQFVTLPPRPQTLATGPCDYIYEMRNSLPAMIRRMAGLDGDKCAATGGASFTVRNEARFDDGAFILCLDDGSDQFERRIGRRWTQEFDGVVGGDGAGRRA